MSTRRIDDLRFDHGAQYFTARDVDFRRQVAHWLKEGTVQRWRGRIGVADRGAISPTRTTVHRYVGVPGMNALCKRLLLDVPDARFSCTVQSARHGADGWQLTFTDGAELNSRWLVCTAPPAQAQVLVEHDGARLALQKLSLAPCWAVMAQFDGPLLPGWDGLFVNEGPLSWVASQDSRPGRPSAHCWLAHASPEWSHTHLEASREEALRALLQSIAALPEACPAGVVQAVAHRWRYSIARDPLQTGALAFPNDRLVLAGDWCAGSRVEGAWRSGMAASRYI